jgi:hypothetical protein
LVVAGGIGAFVFLGNDETANNQSTVPDTSQVNEVNETTSEQASIEDLLTRNASLKCTFSVNEEDSVNNGTAYFSGDKNMYGEFTNTINNETTNVFVIRNGDTQYVWMKDSDTGFKTDVTTSDKASQQQMSQQFDPEQKYQFDCVNWEKDESLFTPPASVTFTDVGEQSRQIQEAIEAASQQE